MGSTTKVHQFSGGRLILTPTNTNAPATDCGGTQLGTVSSAKIRFHEKTEPITAVEFGSAMVDATILDHELFLTVTGAGWDTDLINNVFYGAAGGTPLPRITYPANVGKLAASIHGVKLMWLPNDDTSDPAWIAYRAIPWTLPKPVFFSARHPTVVTATFILVRDASDRIWDCGALTDLSV